MVRRVRVRSRHRPRHRPRRLEEDEGKENQGRLPSAFEENDVAVIEDDDSLEMLSPTGIDSPRLCFVSPSYWKDEQSRILSEVTSAFIHESLVTLEGQHLLARKVVWGALNLCLIDLVQQGKGELRDKEFHREILLDMAQLVVLYAKQSLTPPGFVMDVLSMVSLMDYHTPVRSNDEIAEDCRNQVQKVHEARLASDSSLYVTELTTLCRMRTRFLVYYDRTIATYDKCRNVLMILGYGGAIIRIEATHSEHCAHRSLMHTTLVVNQADLHHFRNRILLETRTNVDAYTY
jgi:hypothetical protein